jgi:hypothetical protein
MVLLDHFRPPLSSRRHWHAFHNAWATYLATDLNQKLPEGFFAEPNVQFGIEIDVATFDIKSELTNLTNSNFAEMSFFKQLQPWRFRGSLARSWYEESPNPIAHSTWQPPSPTQQLTFDPTAEIVEISILSDAAGPTLKSAIELVSPANKDRPAQRQAFLSKCEAYLREGVSVIIIDVVTARKTNFHQELLQRLKSKNSPQPEPPEELYAAAYHPIANADQVNLDIWYETFAVGDRLPTMPLWLNADLCFPLMLQETYEQTCRSQRIS